MDRLSSCYFCGGALDVSLAEYPVVPKEFQPADGDSPTVVLCSTCRRKLGAVIEEVVAATTGEGTSDDTLSSADGDPQPANEAGENSALRTPPKGAPPDEGAEQSDPAENSALRTPSTGQTAESGAESTGESADLRTPPDGDAGEGEQAATDLGEGSAERADSHDDGPHLTKLEYNRVMRLLQNRPFPVDRAEIREVATSAYDLDEREFDAVVDAAIDRGLIAERDGQFVEPS